MARDTSKLVTIPGELHSAATGNIVAAAEEIFDYTINKYQKDINQNVSYIRKDDSSVSPIPSFDPQSQTVHVDPQILSEAQKKQVRVNIGLGNGDIDVKPTSGSGNVVTSGGVYESIEKIGSSVNSQVGYYICSTPGNASTKTISASGYTLIDGGGIRIKFSNKNTAENATLNIENTGVAPLFYNGTRVSTNNSWYSGEVVTLFYDGTSFQCNSLPDTNEYDVSAHNTHEVTETTVITRTSVYEGNVVDTWQSETAVSDSSTSTFARKETNTGKPQNTSNVEGPTAKYDESAKKTSVVWITTNTFTGVVNNYTFDEAVKLVPMSYRHGGLKLRFIDCIGGSSNVSENKYVEYMYTGTDATGNQNKFTDISNWDDGNEIMSSTTIDSIINGTFSE